MLSASSVMLFRLIAFSMSETERPIACNFSYLGMQSISVPTVPLTSTIAVCGNCSMRFTTTFLANLDS